MNIKSLIDQIQRNSETLVEKHERIHQTFKNRDRDSQAWEAASNDFHESYDQLAFPGGLEKEITALKAGNPEAIALAIIYLQADPYFHRSGYIKQKLIRFLKKSKLTQNQIAQLHEAILKVINENGRREFIEYCRLARTIQNASLVQSIQNIVSTAHDERIIARAQQMLDTIKK